MSLTKSSNTTNFSSIHKVQIIKNVFISEIPDARSIYLSEISFATGKEFQEIEITDGTFDILDIDEGAGTTFKIQATFRHPKVREEADLFIEQFRGKLIRLVLTDKNGFNRLTPPGKLIVSEAIPGITGYNGYTFNFSAVGERISFITMDAYPTPPVDLWDQVYYSGSNVLALVNQAFTLDLEYFNWFGSPKLLMLNFDGNIEIITFAAMEKKTISRPYAAAEGSYLQISGAIDNGDGTYTKTQFPPQGIAEKIEMKNAGCTRWYSLDAPFKLDLSGNAINSDDFNTLLEKYSAVLTAPQYWDGTKYFFIDGNCPQGYNLVPNSPEALAIKAQMLAIEPLSYRDNA